MTRKFCAFVILMFIVQSFIALSQEGQGKKEINYNDPKQVNSLSSPDLANAIEQGKIKNIDIVDYNKLIAAIETKPSLMGRTEVLDAAFKKPETAAGILDRYPYLLINNKIAERYSQEAVNNVKILNDNPRAKADMMYTLYKIKFEGENENAKIEGYAKKDDEHGNKVIFIKTEKMEFKASDFPDATVTKEGFLILPTGEEIQLGKAYKGNDGKIILEKNSLFKIGSTTFSNLESNVILDYNTISTNGYVLVYPSGIKDSVVLFTGSLSRMPNGFQINENTNVVVFFKDQNGIIKSYEIYTPLSPIDLTAAIQDCRQGRNCAAIDFQGISVEIKEGYTAVSFQPGQVKKTSLGYGFRVPPGSDFSVSAPNGVISIYRDGVVKHSQHSQTGLSEFKEVGKIQPKEPKLFKNIERYVGPHGFKITENYNAWVSYEEGGMSFKFTFILK